MARARRQPPLFEFLGGSDRRPLPVAPGSVPTPPRPAGSPEVPPPLRKPVEVPIRSGTAQPASQAARPDADAFPRAPAPRRHNWVFWGGFALAGVALLGLVVWNLAYRLGSRDEQAKLKAFVEPKPTPDANLPASPVPPIKVRPSGDPAPGTASGVVADTPPADVAAPAPLPVRPAVPATSGPAIGPDPRKPGMNYLELATLTYRDGMQAVDFLSRSGVQASLAPAQRGVDPAKAAANNAPHVLFLSEGVPSDRFKSSERDRRQLEDRVEQLGKRFQRELKGPTDFSRPMWRLYREAKN